jgi:hypothetical protein
VKPESPRAVTGSYSVAPISSNFFTVASRSSTCQYVTAPPGGFDAPSGPYLRSMIPSSSPQSPILNSTYTGWLGGGGKAQYGSIPNNP